MITNISVQCWGKVFLNPSHRICGSIAVAFNPCTDLVDDDPEKGVDDANTDKEDRPFDRTDEDINEGDHCYRYCS